MKRRREVRFPLWSLGSAPRDKEQVGYTRVFFVKSAQAVEKEGDGLRTAAKERGKSAQAIEKIGNTFWLSAQSVKE